MTSPFEELLVHVISPRSKRHMAEALACYRSGAFRACIVSAWTAAVFDIIEKLRELDIAGDAQAHQYVQELDTIRTANDVVRSLEMERSILRRATEDFELLSHQERVDLERLQEDRHRCAHPSLDQPDEPYQPPAELARYHLHTVFSALATRPAAQGKGAFDRIVAEVTSPLFPVDVEQAVRVLGAGPLQRPRATLLRAFVIASIKAILVGDDRDNKPLVARVATAIAAARRLHPTHTLEVAEQALPDIARRLRGADVARIVKLVAEIPELSDAVPDDVLIKIERFIETAGASEIAEAVPRASIFPTLRDAVTRRVETLTRDDLVSIVRDDPGGAMEFRPILDRAINLTVNSRSWDNTNEMIGRVLLPLLPAVAPHDVATIARSAATNVEVRYAHMTAAFFRQIREAGTISDEGLREIAESSGVESLAALLEEKRPPTKPAVLAALKVGHRVIHPIFGAGTVERLRGEGRDLAVQIAFDDHELGSKTIKPAYTTLDVVQMPA